MRPFDWSERFSHDSKNQTRTDTRTLTMSWLERHPANDGATQRLARRVALAVRVDQTAGGAAAVSAEGLNPLATR